MKKLLIISLLLIGLTAQSQINGIVGYQQTRKVLDSVYQIETYRFIIVGASIMNNVFSDEAAIETLINATYPDKDVEVYNEAVGGWTTAYGYNNIDAILAGYSADTATTATYVLIHLGGNNVTDNRPYSTDTTIATMEMHYHYMLNAIQVKGFTPILNEISFRDYDDTTYANEENGSLPYNENLVTPLILSRTPEFAFEDGTSYYQLYNILYNNIEFLSPDNVHPNGSGNTALRNLFVSTICKYIFTGVPPTKIEKE